MRVYMLEAVDGKARATRVSGLRDYARRHFKLKRDSVAASKAIRKKMNMTNMFTPEGAKLNSEQRSLAAVGDTHRLRALRANVIAKKFSGGKTKYSRISKVYRGLHRDLKNKHTEWRTTDRLSRPTARVVGGDPGMQGVLRLAKKSGKKP